MACCYAQLRQNAAALSILESLLEDGFQGIAAVRDDPDIAPLRGSELDALLSKCADNPSISCNLQPM